MGHAARPRLGPALLCSAGTNRAAGKGKAGCAALHAAGCATGCATQRAARCAAPRAAGAPSEGCPWGCSQRGSTHCGLSGTRPTLGVCRGTGLSQGRCGDSTGAVGFPCPWLCPRFLSQAPQGQGACCRQSTLLGLYFLGFAATSWNNYFYHKLGFEAVFLLSQPVRDGHSHRTQGLSPVGTSRPRGLAACSALSVIYRFLTMGVNSLSRSDGIWVSALRRGG